MIINRCGEAESKEMSITKNRLKIFEFLIDFFFYLAYNKTENMLINFFLTLYKR